MARKEDGPVSSVTSGSQAVPKSPTDFDFHSDHYRDLLKSLPLALFCADSRSFQFTFVTDYIEKLFGYSPRMWTEQPSFWKEHVYREDAEWIMARRGNAIKESRAYDIEYRVVASDGNARWTREIGRALPENDGKAQVVGALIDLSQKRSAEATLGEGKPWLRKLIDTIPVQIWSGPADGTIDYCNLRWREELGLDLDALRGDGWQQMLYPDDRVRVLKAWRESVVNGTPYEQHERHRMANGQIRWFLCRGIPLRDESGKIIRWFGVNTDIDDQKRAEEALRESEQRWRAVFENALVGVSLLDSSLRFIDANSAAQRIFGYDISELRSLSSVDLTFEGDREAYKAIAEELIAGKRDHFCYEKRNRRKNGEVIWTRLTGSTVNTVGSRFWVIVTEDITERKQLHDQLQQERDRLRLLLDLNRHFVSKLDVREFFQALLDGVRRLGWYWASVLLPETGSPALTVYLSPDNAYLREGQSVPIDDSLQGEVYRSGKPVAFQIDELPALCSMYRKSQWMQDIVRREGIKAACALPLIHEGAVIGVLFLMTRTAQDLPKSEMNFLQELASLVAASLHNSLRFQSVNEQQEKLLSERKYIEAESLQERGISEIIGNSPAILEVLRQVSVVAPTESSVLITGETGTGKELIARAIHNSSARRNHSFIKIDCTAIPSALMESELFGYEKGAFTGASAQKLGRIELADHGTLFLDEIGDVPLELQSKLLRILQDYTFERLGGTRTRKIDVRVIAATHRNLEVMVETGSFREDLYYRLKVFPIMIPPLRDRPTDIPLLIKYWVQKCARRMGKAIPTVPQSAMDLFLRYPWPGNVRELQHFIERSVILTSGRELQAPLSELQQFIQRKGGRRPANTRTLEDVERESILQALEESNWVVGGPQGAARKLGIKRTTLASRMERLGISRPRR